jgi:hypothetical protein
MNNYYIESDGPMPKRKQKHMNERKLTNRFIKKMFKTGALRTWRFPDGIKKNPYDGFILTKHLYMPFEAKKVIGGVTFNVEKWIENQPHQFGNLAKDFKCVNCKPFFLIHWMPIGTNKYKDMVLPIHLLPLTKIKIANMKEINTFEELEKI